MNHSIIEDRTFSESETKPCARCGATSRGFIGSVRLDVIAIAEYDSYVWFTEQPEDAFQPRNLCRPCFGSLLQSLSSKPIEELMPEERRIGEN